MCCTDSQVNRTVLEIEHGDRVFVHRFIIIEDVLWDCFRGGETKVRQYMCLVSGTFL
jgi:hypothetical protein